MLLRRYDSPVLHNVDSMRGKVAQILKKKCIGKFVYSFTIYSDKIILDCNLKFR